LRRRSASKKTLTKLFAATYLLQLRHSFSSNPYSILCCPTYLLRLRQLRRTF
jgi:hypothetical protein